MASAGSIFVDLLLKDSQYVAGLNKARGNTKSFSSGVNRDLDSTKKAFQDVLNPVTNLSTAIGRLSGIVATAFSVQRLAQYTDTWRQLSGRLSLVEDSLSGITRTQENLLEVAQRTRQPLEGVASFYSRLAQFIPEAERAQYDLLGVTESVSAALAITGETGASASAAMIQFTQAIGTNFEAAGQELRSLQEQAPRLTQALMKSLGDGTKSLQQLKEEGVLTRQSVLNALAGYGEEGRKLREELEKVPVTISQAFTQLDNAFLTFIGNSEAANAGASTLAEGIKLLADNLDTVATGIGVVSTVMVARLLPGLLRGVVAWTANIAQVIAYNTALNATNIAQAQNIILTNATRQAAINAATGVTALTTASSASTVAALGLSRALALVGGPIGVALITAISSFYILGRTTDATKEALEGYNSSLVEFEKLMGEASRANTARAAEIRKDADKIIEAHQKELESLTNLIEGYKLLGPLGAAASETLGKFGIGTSPSEAIAKYDALFEVLRKQKALLSGKDEGSNTTRLDSIYSSLEQYITGNTPKLLQFNKQVAGLKDLLQGGRITLEQYNEAYTRLQKAFKSESGLNDITRYQKLTLEAGKFLAKKQEELKALQAESDFIGLSTVEIDKLRAAREIDAQAAEQASVLRGKDKEDFLLYVEELKQGTLEAIQANYDASRTVSAGIKEFFAKYVEDATNAAQNIQNVLTNAFKGAEDAFVNFVKTGKLNFKDLANSIIEDLIRIQFRKAVAGIIGAATGMGGTGAIAGGGGGGVGLLASFAGFFADGGYLQPGQWGIAGEEGAEVIMAGRSGATVIPQTGGGGNIYNIDARGADSGAVARIEAALYAFAGPGVIERRFRDASTRGVL